MITFKEMMVDLDYLTGPPRHGEDYEEHAMNCMKSVYDYLRVRYEWLEMKGSK